MLPQFPQRTLFPSRFCFRILAPFLLPGTPRTLQGCTCPDLTTEGRAWLPSQVTGFLWKELHVLPGPGGARGGQGEASEVLLAAQGPEGV